MRKSHDILPSVVLVSAFAALAFSHDAVTVTAFIASAILWAFWFFVTIPKPDYTPRLNELDHQVADLVDSRDEMTKSIDALKTAVGMRQLR